MMETIKFINNKSFAFSALAGVPSLALHQVKNPVLPIASGGFSSQPLFAAAPVILLLFLFIAFWYARKSARLFRDITKSRIDPALQNSALQQIEEEEVADSVSAAPLGLAREEPDKFFRHMVETVQSGLFLAEMNGDLYYVNQAFAQMTGYDQREDLVGRNIRDVIDDVEGQFWIKLAEKKCIKECRVFVKKFPKQGRVLMMTANYVFNNAGEPVGIEGAANDITEKFRLENAVLVEKRKLEAILGFYEKIDTVRNMRLLCEFVVEEVSGILEAQRCWLMFQKQGTQNLVLMSSRGIDSRTLVEQEIPLEQGIVGKAAQREIAEGVEKKDQQQFYRMGELPCYLGAAFISIPFYVNDDQVGVINVAEKVDCNKKYGRFSETDFNILRIMAGRIATAMENVLVFKELNLQTVTDPITQIYNYRLFSESLDQEMKRVARDKSDLCVCMIDIDNFKTYNDTFGHLGGDELLRIFGKILKKNLRGTDIVCRYAGDEFCVVFPNTTLEGARLAAEKVRLLVANFPFQRQVTISIGVAQYQEGMEKRELIERADKALYRAKDAGRDQVALYKEEGQSV